LDRADYRQVPPRIVQVNAVYDPSAESPDALLDGYRTLTELSSALRAAGADVHVVQRFRTSANVARDDVPYTFVADTEAPWLAALESSRAVVDAVKAARPEVVHANGLIFPALVANLRGALDPTVAIVAQHHGGLFPDLGWGPLGAWRRSTWRSNLAQADAVSFTTEDQADDWRRDGILGDQHVLGIVESGTRMAALPLDRARAVSGLRGSPLILWVGRLTANKDPIAVLDGLDLALPHLPQTARVAMVYSNDTMHAEVSARIAKSDLLRDRIDRVGVVAASEMPAYYSSADIFISGSRDEGSGYALVESMACGLAPVVTDIPSFRKIVGTCGNRWEAGNAEACAAALIHLCSGDLAKARAEAREHYQRELTWPAIAEQTVGAYRSLIERRRPAAKP
jgi:glycosyltransferase involved in cell wall biosynthesis